MKLSIDQSSFDAVIFDFNGVLLLDTPWHETAWRETFESLSSRRWSNEEMSRFVHGRSNRDIFCSLLGRNLDPSELEEVAELKESKYRRICRQNGEAFRLSPGAPELLSSLRDHDIPLAIATASGKKNVHFFYQELALSHWFDLDAIIFDDGSVRGKPAPDLYLKAATRLGVKPGRAIVLEDSIAGLQAARNAGAGLVIATGQTLPPALQSDKELFDIRLDTAGELAGLITYATT